MPMMRFSFIVLAVKSVWQYYVPVADVLGLLDLFRRMVNDSLRIGLLNDALSLRKLSLLSYNQLARYHSPSCYKLCAISRAAGILAARNKSARRGYPTRTPYSVRIAGTTTRIVASFRRDDARIRTRIASKYGERRTSRTSNLLHNATKTIVAVAVQRRTAIVLENIEGIRSLYRKGNGQGRKYRGRMNRWSFGEAQRQIEYKARWAGLPVIRLSRRETRGSSVSCPRCGERLQSDKRLERKLWC